MYQLDNINRIQENRNTMQQPWTVPVKMIGSGRGFQLVSAAFICLMMLTSAHFNSSAYASQHNQQEERTGESGNRDDFPCYEDEIYDAQNDECIYECKSDEECDELDKLADERYDERNKFYDSAEGQQVRDSFKETPNTKEPSMIFRIIEKGKLDLVTENIGNEKPTKQRIEEIWQMTRRVSGKKVRSLIHRFVLYNGGDEVDGVTLASVSPAGNGLDKWRFSVNLKADPSKKPEMKLPTLESTLVHETAHLIALNPEQIDPEKASACQTYNPGEGCAKSNSYIYRFADKFWTEEGRKATQSEDDEAKRYSQELYDKNPENFWSSYGATNPVEDMAESYTEFIYRDKKDLTNKSGKAEKALFFYNYPELVKLRATIKKRIGAHQKKMAR